MHIDKTLFTAEELAAKTAELGKLISEDYKDEEILMVCTLRGAIVFFADLIRQISSPCQIDFITASSYGDATISSGKLNIKKDLETNIEGKHIIIVEDIVDSGITLSALKKMLLARNPKSLKICAMLSKPSRRVCPVDIDYCGFEIPDEFVIGYGLDYAQNYRQLPYIGTLAED